MNLPIFKELGEKILGGFMCFLAIIICIVGLLIPVCYTIKFWINDTQDKWGVIKWLFHAIFG